MKVVADVIYVALCLELDASLWTGDKKLKNHLNDQGFMDFFKPA
jgi:predicted nucleic acid-binding protein